MRKLDRIAGWLGYIPKRAVPQTFITFRGEDRAHIVMVFSDSQLVGEVERFKGEDQ